MKLKPCPGCGSMSICVCSYTYKKEDYWGAHCQDCDWSYGGSNLVDTEKKAIDGWNKRKLNEKTKRLRK